MIFITSVALVSSLNEKWLIHMNEIKEGGGKWWQDGEGRRGTKQAATILGDLWKLESSLAKHLALSTARNLMFNQNVSNFEVVNKFIFSKALGLFNK